MPLLLPAFSLIILTTALSTSFPPPGDHSQYDGYRNAMEQMEKMNNDNGTIPVVNTVQHKGTKDQQAKECNDSRDCLENQYCHLSSDTAECQDCKTKEMLCQQDEECCRGWVCALSKCTEHFSSKSGRARCDLKNQCAPGFCCYRTERLPFSVCLPHPSEGEQCQIQTSNLLNLLTYGAGYDMSLQSCPCAEGLVCTNKRSLISTCEKPDEVIDFTNYREDSLFQPLVRRDEDLSYYDAELVPWPSQDDQFAFIDFQKKGEVNEDIRNDFQIFSADISDSLKEGNLQFDDHVDEPGDPSEADFQEFKQLASEMGQYFGPGSY